ncbi:MAG: glycosyltransferase family 2 protein [Acidimicrobiales bacterium]
MTPSRTKPAARASHDLVLEENPPSSDRFRPRLPSTTVVIPAFNEGSTIWRVVREVREVLGPNSEVVVVDDGSTDQTGFLAEAAGARVVRIPENSGNGTAIKAGIRAATRDVVAFMDGDGQHGAEDLVALLEHAAEYDMVVGARHPSSHASIGRRLANAFYNRLASFVTRKDVADLTSGFRVVRRQVAREMLPLLPNGFSYPTTITLACLRSGYSVRYVPFHAARRVGRSKIKTLKDGPGFVLIIFKVITLFSPFKVFLALAALPALLAVAGAVATLATSVGLGIVSALFFNAALVLVGLGFVSEQICAMRFERLQAQPPPIPIPAMDRATSEVV